jgi:hypothetical protein
VWRVCRSWSTNIHTFVSKFTSIKELFFFS